MATDKSYLWKRGNTYSATMEIPKKLQPVLRTRTFVQALGTDSLAEANRRKLPYLMEWRRLIAAARSGAADPLAEYRREALDYRNSYVANDTYYDHERAASNAGELLDVIREKAKDIAEKYGKEAGDRFLAGGMGTATFLEETYKLWLGQVEVSEQTKKQHEVAVARYLEWAGRAVTIEETSRKKAGEYVSVLLSTFELDRRTIQRHCSSLSSLWRWYKARGYIDTDANPWLGHGLSSKKGKTPYRRAYSDELILKLLRAPYGQRYETVLPDLVRLALLTGTRLEVFCAMKRTAIEKREDGYWATIEDDKTEAGTRIVPLHSAASALIDRRLKDNDEYLFAGLDTAGPDDKRSWNVGKAFRYHRRKAGVVEKGQDFHAFRNTFIACMEGHEVPESTVKLLVGHKRESMTYGHYSKGERVKLREAIEQLDYGAEIMGVIRNC
jgi:integrase